MSRHPNHQRIVDELTANHVPLIEWAADALIALGAKPEWDMDDNFNTTETLVSVCARRYDLPSAGNQDAEALRFYGEAAIALGYPTDIEDDEDEDA